MDTMNILWRFEARVYRSRDSDYPARTVPKETDALFFALPFPWTKNREHEKRPLVGEGPWTKI
jgi:tRNA G46 methylase TrmB